MPNSKARFIILKIVIAVMFAAGVWKLFCFQGFEIGDMEAF